MIINTNHTEFPRDKKDMTPFMNKEMWKIGIDPKKKRIPPASSSLNRKKALRAGLTVETALVLPIFLFAMLSVILIGEALRFSANMNASLMDTGRKLSVYAYAGSRAGLEGKTGMLAGKAVSLTAGKSMVINDLGKGYIEESPVEGGSGGLSFIHSGILGPDQMIDLNTVWKMKIPFSIPGIQGFRVADRARIRAFTGYDNTRREDRSKEDEEMVFITDKGTVYHRDRNCKHLNIKISRIDGSKVGKARNSNGGKYYCCEYCGKKGGDRYYITEDGDRYHTKLSCPGLKRTIRTVPLSETGGRPPCADCG